MLLRRITEHVKAQNWTAVALDFFIVVVGVFIGIQVANWNDAREDNNRALAYLERISDDLDADITNYAEQGSFWSDVSAYGSTALAYAKTGDANGASHWELVLAFFQASQLAEFYTRVTTYEELKSAGELGLIQSVSLREQLANYYTNADNPALSERPRYREHIRGLIPFDIQLYIWENCYRTVLGVNQEMFACDSPMEDAQAAALLAELTANKALIEELRFWRSTLHVAKLIGRDRTDIATRIRKEIDTELGVASAPTTEESPTP
jgi:hypothetical protein